MAFTQAIQNIVYGISSVPAIIRPEGYSEDQVNWFNDPTRGMVRRASAKVLADYTVLDDLGAVLQTITLTDESVIRTYALTLNMAKDKIQVRDWTDSFGGALQEMELPTGWDIDADYGLFFIDKKVYVVNRDIEVATEAYVSMEGANTTSTLVIPQSIGYSETISATVKWAGDTETVLVGKKSYTSTAYTGNNQAAADASRARDTARAALARGLRTTYTSPFGNGVQTLRVLELNGSIEVMLSIADVAIANTGVQKDYSLVVLPESSNLGFTYTSTDSIIAYNHIVSSPEGLPKYASQNGTKKIQSDPRTDIGAYYLKPASISGITDTDRILEVSWVETVAPKERARFTPETLPIVYDIEKDTIQHMPLKDRPAGDVISNLPPTFVGYKIKAMVGVQERLGIVARDKIWFSRTDAVDMMWRTSAAQVLSTDAFGIGNAGNISYYEHVVEHNKALLLVASKTQSKLDGVEALTLGATLPVTTNSTVDTTVKPIAIGSKVYLPTNTATNAGVLEYATVNSTGTDDVRSITDHVKGILIGKLVALYGDDRSNLIVARTDGMATGELAICNINTVDAENTIYAWSKWQLPDIDILHISVRKEAVRVVGSRTHNGVLTHCMLDIDTYFNPYEVASRVCLDNQVTFVPTYDGENFKPSEHYPTGDYKVVPIDGETPLITEPVTVAPNGDIEFYSKAGVTYLIGVRYSSLLELSTIYQYDREGRPITQDRLRVLHLIVSMDGMYRLFLRINSKYFEVDDEWMVCESQANLDTLFELEAFTGEYRYGVSMNSTDCNLILGTDYELSGTITGIAYRGNLIRTG